MKGLVAIFAVAVGFAAVAPAPASASNQFPVKRIVNSSVSANGTSALNVVGRNGDLSLYADGGNSVRVTAVLRARSVEDANAIVLRVYRSGNAVKVEATCPTGHLLFWSYSDCAVDYQIHYPRAMATDVRNDNGDVLIQDPSGNVAVHMDNGDVDVKNAASNVSVALAHGDVTIDLADGWHGNAVAMSASAGDLDLRVPRGFSGTLDAHTRFGDVTDNAGLHGGRAKVSASVTFGDVTVHRS